MFRNSSIILMITLVGVLMNGCNRSRADSRGGNLEKTVKQKASEEEAATHVESIVFVGQKQACECTRNRIDASWQALQNVVQDGPDVPIKRVQRDVDAQQAEKLSEQKSCMVVPCIYFLDEHSGVVTLLQGEVREDQIATLLR